MKKAKRIIIKVGSSSLVNSSGALNTNMFKNIISTIKVLIVEGNSVALVTSGAIAVGMGKLGLDKKPKNMALKQACAALGQIALMNEYEKYALESNLLCAQILVNHDDFENRNRMFNLTNTFEELFNNNILPIINENDALAVDEIKVGDNDTLSALIAPMISADLLILASDIDGLYNKNPKVYKDAVKIECIEKIDSTVDDMVGEITSNVGTGGMETKIKAGRIATKAGCDMVILSSEDINKIPDLLKGEKIGTLFKSEEKIMHSKDHWIVYNAYAKGTIIVDDGAKEAILNRKSLLPSGIIEVKGNFKDGCVVFISDKNNKCIAKGITNYNSYDINNISGLHSEEAKEIIHGNKKEVIHANSLVILKGEEYGKVR